MNQISITDMSGAYVEHSYVIVNFVAMLHKQLKNSLCRVFSDNVQYKWEVDGKEKTVIPDASINCQVRARRGNSFVNAPQFVMEVLSPSTEKYDRNDKMEIYREQEISEYWIVDWSKRQIEMYELEYDENGVPYYYLFNTITEENKAELRLIHMPNVQVNFDDLFDIDY